MDQWSVFYVSMTGSVTVVTFVFGLLVLGQSLPRAANRFLAAFLFLIAANQGMETATGYYVANGQGLPYEPVLTLKQLAYLFAAVDPFVLYYFASIFPQRDRWNHPLAVGAVGLGSVAMLSLAPTAYLTTSAWFGFFTIDVFTALVYSAVFVRFALLVARHDAGRVERLMLYAAAVAAIPVISRATYSFARFVGSGTLLPNYAMWVVAIVLLVAALALDGRTPLASRTFTRASLLGCTVGFVAFLPVYLVPIPFFGPALGPVHDFVGINAPVRWLLFSLLVSVAVFRDDMLGMSLPSRRRAARIAMVAGILVLTIVIGAAVRLYVPPAAFAPRPIDLILFVLVLALSGSVRAGVGRLADAVYGLPDVHHRGRAVGLYEAAVGQAQREGRLVPVDPDLARLRHELRIDAATADLVERAMAAPTSGALEVGATIDSRYRVEHFIGRGSGGRVFSAKDELLDRTVCLKEVVETVAVAGDRLLNEARAAVRVRHANVVAVFDVLPRTGRVIIVSELLPGTLAEHVETQGPLSLDTAARAYGGVLAGLEALHAANVLHRDLKPANVFLTDDGTAKIGDFGISVLDVGATLAPGELLFGGTAGYLAPEVLDGQRPTHASDLYAVGRMMERTLADDARMVFAGLIERALAHDPTDRYASAADMRAALHQAVARTAGPSE